MWPFTCRRWALVLPYSFSPDVRIMVSTSFPTKLVESLPSGRPVVAYGPEYASVPRVFLEEGLPLVATDEKTLRQILRSDLPTHDRPGLMDQYRAYLERNHSLETQNRILDAAF